MVTLRELFEADADGIDVPVPEEIIVTITDRELQRAGIPLDESQWMPSAEKGLWLRVDPPRPEMNQLRHVHIAQKKHIRAPNQQASWNDDQTRHDRKRFNTKFAVRADVQAVAKVALGLPSDTVLEELTSQAGQLLVLLESGVAPEAGKRYFRTKVAAGISPD